jgi:hypothetical protein
MVGEIVLFPIGVLSYKQIKTRRNKNKMISVWHLFWIVPLSSSLGFLLAALLQANGRINEK